MNRYLRRDTRSTNDSSWLRYAGLTLTRITPAAAAPNCRYTHSAQFVDHTPIRSPGFSPRLCNAAAVRTTFSSSPAHVSRIPLVPAHQSQALRVHRCAFAQQLTQ